MTIPLVIAGCCGRMGLQIAELALRDSAFTIRAALESPGHEQAGRPYGAQIGHPELNTLVSDDAKTAFGQGEVVIDFTTPQASLEHVKLAGELKKPIVIGTTGFSQAQLSELKRAAEDIPLLVSPNMSVGVNVLFELAATAAARLRDFKIELKEVHHTQKKDSPSGTAKRLVEIVAAVRNVSSESIPVQALREGNVVGDHTIVFMGASERLELTHHAQSREVFAQGALVAARFLHGKAAGFYSMKDVLGAGCDDKR